MLKLRVLSGLAMFALLLVVLFALPPLATLILMTLVVLAAAWEWAALCTGLPAVASSTANAVAHNDRSVRVSAVLIVALLLPLVWQVSRAPAGLRALLWVAALWWCVALLWLLLAPQRVSRAAAAAAGLLALLPAWAAVGHLRSDDPRGARWLLCALLIIFAADTGAYFAGRAWGRVKLAPQVSPGKTWEGVLGGLLLVLLVSAASAPLLGLRASAPLLGGALAAAAFSVVGDLTESMLKRHAGLKDSGALLPGHGGVLDRIDGLCAGIPVLLLCWQQLGVLA